MAKKEKTTSIGEMFRLVYRPETRKTLPYWDIQPVVIILERHKDGFTGINLHYLDPKIRNILWEQLYSIITTQKINKHTRINIKAMKEVTYRIAKPCIKRYKYSQIQEMELIHPDSWKRAVSASKKLHDTDMYKPRFMGKQKKSIWEESRMKLLKDNK